MLRDWSDKMKKPLILKSKNEIMVSFNGKRLIIPMNSKYKNMSDSEIVNDFLISRNLLDKEVKSDDNKD